MCPVCPKSPYITLRYSAMDKNSWTNSTMDTIAAAYCSPFFNMPDRVLWRPYLPPTYDKESSRKGKKPDCCVLTHGENADSSLISNIFQDYFLYYVYGRF